MLHKHVNMTYSIFCIVSQLWKFFLINNLHYAIVYMVLYFEGNTAKDLSSPGGPQSTEPVQETEASGNGNKMNNNGGYHMIVLYSREH